MNSTANFLHASSIENRSHVQQWAVIKLIPVIKPGCCVLEAQRHGWKEMRNECPADGGTS